MSILPSCTCSKRIGYVFGEYSGNCPRHRSSALWMKQRVAQREAELAAVRQQALSRPVHGGYPDARKASHG